MSGDHNMNQIKEGYRHYDNPVAMPNLVETVDLTKGITLEQYFAGLDKLHLQDEVESVRDHQVGGDHYQKSIQPWDIISEWKLDFWEGNIVKYILRWKDKDGVKDLKKAKHYIEYLIERESNEK
jgi:hypothetical protein